MRGKKEDEAGKEVGWGKGSDSYGRGEKAREDKDGSSIGPNETTTKSNRKHVWKRKRSTKKGPHFPPQSMPTFVCFIHPVPLTKGIVSSELLLPTIPFSDLHSSSS